MDLNALLIVFTIFFVVGIVFSLFFSFVVLYFVRRREERVLVIRQERQQFLIDLLYDNTVDLEDAGLFSRFEEFQKVEKIFFFKRRKYRLLRQIMIDEMQELEKNVFGKEIQVLYDLYERSGLHKDSLEKIKSKHYYLMVKGVRELSAMNHKKYYRIIYRLTNHKQEEVRMEAQAAMIKSLGIKGLRFLSTVSYSISDWQQMVLLHLLPKAADGKPKGIEKWLESENDSVVIFSLILAGRYNCFELLDPILGCIYRSNDKVKIQSIITLRDIYDEYTEGKLIDYYPQVGKPVRLVILSTLQSIVSDKSVPFLCQLLESQETEILYAVVRVLHTICDDKQIITYAGEKTPFVEKILGQIKFEENLY